MSWFWIGDKWICKVGVDLYSGSMVVEVLVGGDFVGGWWIEMMLYWFVLVGMF